MPKSIDEIVSATNTRDTAAEQRLHRAFRKKYPTATDEAIAEAVQRALNECEPVITADGDLRFDRPAGLAAIDGDLKAASSVERRARAVADELAATPLTAEEAKERLDKLRKQPLPPTADDDARMARAIESEKLMRVAYEIVSDELNAGTW